MTAIADCPTLKLSRIKSWLQAHGHRQYHANIQHLLNTLVLHAEHDSYPTAWPEDPHGCGIESIFLIGDELNYTSTSDSGGAFYDMADLLESAEGGGRWAIHRTMPTAMALAEACAKTARVLDDAGPVRALIDQFKPTGWAHPKFGVSDIPYFHRPRFVDALRSLRATVGDPVVKYDTALEHFLAAATALKASWDYAVLAMKAAPGELSWDTLEDFMAEPKRKLPRIVVEVAERLYPAGGLYALAEAAKLAAAEHSQRLDRERLAAGEAETCRVETDTMDVETMLTDGWELAEPGTDWRQTLEQDARRARRRCPPPEGE